MRINEEIKRIRMQSLLSQEDFADSINISFCSVNRWENDRAVPNYKALTKIKKFCEDRGIDFNIDISNLGGK
ncbi:helix-turn-helix domain-containing protein [Gardnerella leopoldii]|uniref:helix-turn-helix domain-containing protein n=1 Tax=Gardnerella leopoldii TaxID=2792978 RepID=UPI0039708973